MLNTFDLSQTKYRTILKALLIHSYWETIRILNYYCRFSSNMFIIFDLGCYHHLSPILNISEIIFSLIVFSVDTGRIVLDQRYIAW